jgi:hypothetical protein
MAPLIVVLLLINAISKRNGALVGAGAFSAAVADIWATPNT